MGVKFNYITFLTIHFLGLVSALIWELAIHLPKLLIVNTRFDLDGCWRISIPNLPNAASVYDEQSNSPGIVYRPLLVYGPRSTSTCLTLLLRTCSILVPLFS